MLLVIAWKNIWRNKVRSLIVMVSVMMGLWAGAFILAYVFGMINQRLEDAIGSEISHLQLHHPEFDIDYDPQFYLDDSYSLIEEIGANPMVEAVSGRVLVYGMVASASSSTGGKLIGVNPDKENHVTQLGSNVVEGEYLLPTDKNKIIVGKKLADKLKLKIRSKIVLTFQDVNGDIVAGAFRVKGIFRSYNSTIEEGNLYVNHADLSTLLKTNGQVHEIAVLMYNGEMVKEYVSSLTQQYPGALVESWKELSPELGLMIDSLDQYMVIFFVIILLALSFGIVNTMLMTVLERVKEIGMLMAIGMNKIRLFGMIFWETIFMVLIAAPLGLLLAYVTIYWLSIYGLDLSAIYQEGYAAYGFKPIIYPKLEAIYYYRIMTLVIITAIMASIYPAITALRLDPVKAIRKI
ncbi:MAG: FtsX-like permease family protein [Reichenbachiella sp.]|uniref:ABC transporter permease n=1 Tax=Reichenbachiella sp. TaxID=2184521 RepID=UPI0032643355